MNFARDKFFQVYRETFGSASQSQVNGINSLLSGFESDLRWSTIPLISYALATVKHETAATFEPIVERGSDKYLSKYWTNPTLRKNLGNEKPEDAQRYRGRGYVQITGRNNYTRFGIADDPEKAVEPKKAFEIMTVGMFTGAFTGKKITSYITPTETNYHDARKVINGLDKAELIEDYAYGFEKILTRSQTNQTQKPDNPQIETNAAGDATVSLPTDMPGGVTVPAVSSEPQNLTPSDMQGVVTGHADSAKSIIFRASLKAGAFLTVIWESGLAGKALLIVGGIVVILLTAYEINKYWPKLKPWMIGLVKGFSK